MLKTIVYIFQAKKGMDHPDELVSDVSFGLLGSFFVASFVILGILTGILCFVGFYFDLGFFKVFGVLFGMVLGIDIIVYTKVKKYFKRTSKRVVDYSKNEYQKQKSNVIDIESE